MYRRFLLLVVFLSGIVSLGAELAGSRLIAPYFGTSLVVWSSLIGLILAALSVGYWLGGRWADRSARLESLMKAEFGAGVLLGLVPLVSDPVLKMALVDLGKLEWGVLAGSFVGVLLLLGAPMVLLGCVTPFAVRLSTSDVSEAGRTAGRLFALGTIGSFLGAFLPTVVLIPLLGTRWTFTIFSLVLLGISLAGFLLAGARRWAIMSGAVILFVLGIGLFMASRSIKDTPGLVYETESEYQYISVVERPKGWWWLQLNEGLVVHSKYHPSEYFTYGEWDYFSIAPLLNPSPYEPAVDARRWAIIGAGAGTSARLITHLWGDVQIDGIEPDSKIVDIGREFFNSDLPNYNVEIMDGRAWLRTTNGQYDVIGIDAYRQPYIPFELTTVEFFTEVRDHLDEDGVVVVNVSRPPGDLRLVNAMATTVGEVFPTVWLLHLPDTSLATVIVGTLKPGTRESFLANGKLAPKAARRLLNRAWTQLSDDYEQTLVLTDDLAPVERLMDLMLVSQALDWEQQGGMLYR